MSWFAVISDTGRTVHTHGNGPLQPAEVILPPEIDEDGFWRDRFQETVGKSSMGDRLAATELDDG